MVSIYNALAGIPLTSVLFQTAGQSNNAPWWLLWLILIIALISIVFTWISRLGRQETPAATEVAASTSVVEAETPPAPAPAEEEAAEAPEPDDLTRIEGIGPKISGLLQDAGITTFSQLANADVEQLKEMLLEAKLRIADPTTWPEQAQLAADGQWEALDKLQDDLKGGRRVE